MKTKQFVSAVMLLFIAIFTSCEKHKDEVPELSIPTIDNVEVGLNNNEIGIVGRDFHFNADVVAGDKIDVVQVKIQRRHDENYSGTWSHEVSWEQYKGAKNTTVHQHFDIPDDAVEGKYDFLITVTDENGTKLEEKRTITIYTAENLPVDPQLFSFYAGAVDNNYKILRDVYNSFTPEKADLRLSKDELLTVRAAVSGVKDDGKAVVVLINKKHNHKPENLQAIDYSKTIVVDVSQHAGISASGSFSTTIDRSTTPATLRKPILKIGADIDNNKPVANPVSEIKKWESGDYYLGIIYQNTTHNMGMFYYVEVKLTM